jgi:hypothetical protein
MMKCLCATGAVVVKCVLRENRSIYKIPWPTDLLRELELFIGSCLINSEQPKKNKAFTPLHFFIKSTTFILISSMKKLQVCVLRETVPTGTP